MTIKQISVFLENKSGRLNEVARVLAARCRFRCDIDGCDCHSLS